MDFATILLLIFALGSVSVPAFKAHSFFVKRPDEEEYRDQGSDVTLEWDFYLRPSGGTTATEFLFGEWVRPGFVRNKILAVKKDNEVHKRKGFERKVDWSGNISDCVVCKAQITMHNLSFADFKTYGVEVELGLDRSPLTNWLTLVQFEPAKVIKWPRRIEVEEGNTTTIECKATGRPLPSVVIKTDNRILCNKTRHCEHRISAAKPEHEGEYLCVVTQRNSRKTIRRSLNVTVLETRDIPTTNIADNPTTYITTQHNIHKVVRMVLVISLTIFASVVVVLIFRLCKILRSRKALRDEEESELEKPRTTPDHDAPFLKHEEI